MTRSRHYTDPRLVALYDAQNGLGPDSDFYLSLADRPAMDVLDIGCGTGLLTEAFVRAGHRVTGVDPASAMLDAARRRGLAGAEWIEGTAETVPGAARFDLAVMTGHTFQVLLDDAAVAGTLAAVHRLLRPGGVFAFETRNAAARAWERWTPDHPARFRADGVGEIEAVHTVTAVDGDRVSFRTSYRIGAEILVSDSTLRFAARDHIDAMVRDAGFASVHWSGGWDRTPIGAASQDLIAQARKE